MKDADASKDSARDSARDTTRDNSDQIELLKNTAEQVKNTAIEVVSRYPLASVFAIFGLGVALGAAEEKVRAQEFVTKVGKRVAETQGTGIVDRLLEGALGTIVLNTGISMLSEQLGQFLPTAKKARGSYATQKAKMVN